MTSLQRNPEYLVEVDESSGKQAPPDHVPCFQLGARLGLIRGRKTAVVFTTSVFFRNRFSYILFNRFEKSGTIFNSRWLGSWLLKWLRAKTGCCKHPVMVAIDGRESMGKKTAHKCYPLNKHLFRSAPKAFKPAAYSIILTLRDPSVTWIYQITLEECSLRQVPVANAEIKHKWR